MNGDEDLITVMLAQSRRGVIPCKPSSPQVELTLEHDGNEVYCYLYVLYVFLPLPSVSCHVQVDLSLGSWLYDSREGFVAEEAQMDMSGFYDCKASFGVQQSTTNFMVNVERMLFLFVYYLLFLAAFASLLSFLEDYKKNNN